MGFYQTRYRSERANEFTPQKQEPLPHAAELANVAADKEFVFAWFN
jgi:hypothetical protein